MNKQNKPRPKKKICEKASQQTKPKATRRAEKEARTGQGDGLTK